MARGMREDVCRVAKIDMKDNDGRKVNRSEEKPYDNIEQ